MVEFLTYSFCHEDLIAKIAITLAKRGNGLVQVQAALGFSLLLFLATGGSCITPKFLA